MSQKIQISYGCDFVEINIGEKRFYETHDDGPYGFAVMFEKALKELGYDVEIEDK